LAFVNDENKIDFKKFELFINEITESYSSVQIAKIYINYVYGERSCLDFDDIYKMFEDCLIYTAKSLNGNLILSINAKETVNSIISQNTVNNEISKEDLMVWVLTEFPELFHGHYNWIVNNRVKNFKLNPNVCN
jgi:hypothetical protein